MKAIDGGGSWFSTVGLSAAALVTVVAFSLSGRQQAAVVLAVGTALMLLVAKVKWIHVAVAVGLYMTSSTGLGRASADIAALSRVAAVVVCLILALRFSRRSANERLLHVVLATGSGAYLWALAAGGFSLTWATDAAALLLALVGLSALARNAPPRKVGDGLDAVLLVAVVASLVAGLLGPGIIGGRLAGLFANANTLGFFAALGVVRAATGDRALMQLALLSACAPALVWTGSRASFFAVAAATVATLIHAVYWRSGAGRRRMFAAAGGMVVGVVALWQIIETEVALLRTNNSRESGFDYALRVAEARPWSGVGYTDSAIEVASTPYRWLAETGWPGLAMVLASYAVVLCTGWFRRWPVFFALVFGTAHSVYEGWFFAGGSSLFFAFWVCVLSARAAPARRVRDPEAVTTAGPDPRQHRPVGRPVSGRLPSSGHRQERVG